MQSTVKHLYLAAANFDDFCILTFWLIYILTDFKFPKKNLISGEILC